MAFSALAFLVGVLAVKSERHLQAAPSPPTRADYVMPPCPPPGCAAGVRCTPDQQHLCASRACRYDRTRVLFACTTASCSDGEQNAWETQKDCGGGCPRGCPDGFPCFAGQDCENKICRFRDAYQDTVIAGTAVGGSCQSWDPFCKDGVANGIGTDREPDIDCGDPCCRNSRNRRDCTSRCPIGWMCNTISDCASERCFRNMPEGTRQGYCAAPRVSETRPDLGTRIQGAVVVYGPKKIFFDPAPMIRSIAYLLDVQPSQIVVDALIDQQGPPQFGNNSYLDLRIAKGWNPSGTAPASGGDFISRRLADSILQPGLSASAAVPSRTVHPGGAHQTLGQHVPSWLPSESKAPRRRASSVSSSSSGPRGRLDVSWGAGSVGEPPSEWLARIEGKYGEGAMRRYKRKARQLAHASALGLPWSDIGGAPSKDLLIQDDFEAREAALFSSSARGASGRLLQSNAIPTYNLTTTDTVVGVGMRYMVYTAPDEATLIAERMTSILDIALLPGGWAAERALQVRLDQVVEERNFCVELAVNYTVAEFNMTGVNCTFYLGSDGALVDKWGPPLTDMRPFNGTTTPRQLHHDEEDVLTITSPWDMSWLDHPATTLALMSHVRDGCGREKECPAHSFTTRPMQHTFTADAQARRRLGLTLREEGADDPPRMRGNDDDLSTMDSNPRLPRHLQRVYVPSRSEGGLLLLPNLPRWTLGDVMDWYGVLWDRNSTYGGLGNMTNGAGTIERALGSSPPSPFYIPASVVALQNPRGTPDRPLYDSLPFPVQPIAALLDRFGRQVVSFKADSVMRITAQLDPRQFPASGPVQLSGFRQPQIRDGRAVFNDLAITQNITSIQVQLTAGFIMDTGALLRVSGTTRAFRVIPQPVVPPVIVPRVPMDPILVVTLLAAGVLVGVIGFNGTMRFVRWVRSPAPRAEMAKTRDLLDFDHPDGPEVKRVDEAIGYAPHVLERDRQGGQVVEEPYLQKHVSDGHDHMRGQEEELQEQEPQHPVPPMYTPSELPGVGRAFKSAFDALDEQLGDIDDDLPVDEDDDDDDGPDAAVMKHSVTESSTPAGSTLSSTRRASSSGQAGSTPPKLPTPLKGAEARQLVDHTLRSAGLLHVEEEPDSGDKPGGGWFGWSASRGATTVSRTQEDAETAEEQQGGSGGSAEFSPPSNTITSTSIVGKRMAFAIQRVDAEEFQQGQEEGDGEGEAGEEGLPGAVR